MQAEDIKIVEVAKTETEYLQTISIETFTETFANQNTENDMQKYVLEKLSLNQLAKELQSENSFFYFLKFKRQIIGYLKLNINEAQTEAQGNDCLEIERIYVKKDFHGKSFGKLLIQKAIEIATQMSYNNIWLAVWEHNTKAINFYTKLGFIAFDKHSFLLGDDLQTDIMMKLKLK